MTTVTGLAFPGESTVALREFDIPSPGPTEVRISVKASGICGSDLHSYIAPSGLRAPDGTTLIAGGHEPAGVVESVGSAVTGFAVGDRVLVHHILGCGTCDNCRRGYPVVCRSAARIAYGGGRNGGHAPLLLVEERSLILLPETLSFIDGAMIACGVSTAYSALLKTGVRAGDRLLVTGMGPVGLAVTLLAANMGVFVIGSDPNADRLAEATRHGLAHALSATDAAAELDALTGGFGVDAAIECSGAVPARLLCLEAAGTWGRVVYVGVGRQDLTFSPTDLVLKKLLTVRGSWVSSMAEMEEVTRLLARTGIHPDSLVSETYDLAAGEEAYRRFADGATGKLAFVYT
ncbi:zinc-binding dehydrogenase [Microbacterium lacus]|uniref:Zinc-binding dehydrogenase n=1 Tax=Microbacterium lacus TaxID=415217 RepID=A0ABP4TEL1_9MICO